MSHKCPKNYNHNILVCFKNKKRKTEMKKKINLLLSKKKKKPVNKKTAKKKDNKIKKYLRKMFIANCNNKKRRQCKRMGKVCSMKTNRCVKIPKKTKKIMCGRKKVLFCRSLNKVCNTATNRCRNKIKRKKNKIRREYLRSVKQQKLKIRKPLKTKKKSLLKIPQSKRSVFSYSPTINKKLLSKKSISPIGIDLKKCGSEKIFDKETSTCIDWKDNKAKQILLRNLLSKKKISCREITAPKQFSSNCWFNSFLMTFFISDLGRKYNRWLRESMITHETVTGKKIDEKLHKPFFLLNNYIESILRSNYDDSEFAKKLNTNNIIKQMYSALNKYVNIKKGNTMIDKVGVPSNPLYFYKGLYKYLGEDVIPWIDIDFYSTNNTTKYIKKQIIDYKKTNNKYPKVIFLEIIDDMSDKIKKPLKITVENNTYTLDSAVLRNTKKHHFSAYITCNNNQYAFDGLSKDKRMKILNWKERLNKNISWKLSNASDYIDFNFTKGYSILIYYMTKSSQQQRTQQQRTQQQRTRLKMNTIQEETKEDNQTPETNSLTEKKELTMEKSGKKTIFIEYLMGETKYKKKFILLPDTEMGKVFNIFKENLNLQSSTFKFSCRTKKQIETTDTITTLNLTDDDVITATLV